MTQSLYITDTSKRQKLLDDSIGLQSLTLNDRQINDLEMILSGAFYPLAGFMNEDDYLSVISDMRLSDGKLFPLPIYLDFDSALFKFKLGEEICLRDQEGLTLAVIKIDSIFKLNKDLEASEVYKTNDLNHPAVYYLNNQTGDYALGGGLVGLNSPRHFDFNDIRNTPEELRSVFRSKGWKNIVAFQTRNPMHRAHFEILKKAALDHEAKVLIHPVVGLTKPGDVDHFVRTKCYKEILNKFDRDDAILSLLPLAMRMGGPREALLHAIIRKNFGVTHFIVGRDHAGPGKDSKGNDFYGPYDAQELVMQHEEEINIKMVPFKMQVYVSERDQYCDIDNVLDNETPKNISGTELRELLKNGRDLPEWFTFPEVANILREAYPLSLTQGFTIFFTGLSGSGKSTIANGVVSRFLESSSRNVTLLDGDLVRQHLSSELGFSKEHRNLNIQRISYVASEITKHRGIAICAPIAPYLDQRMKARRLIEPFGKFIEVYVSTSFEDCEHRDVKGLYAKARQGLIKGFTGLDDPYEVPENPEIIVDGASSDPAIEVNKILTYLRSENLISF